MTNDGTTYSPGSPSLTGAFARHEVPEAWHGLPGIRAVLALGDEAEGSMQRLSGIARTVRERAPDGTEYKLKLLDAVERELNRLGKFVERAWSDLSTDENGSAGIVRSKLAAEHRGYDARELRSAIARLELPEKRAVLNEVLKRGDRDPDSRAVLAAALNAPAVVTGLPPAEAELFRKRWIEQFHPELHERIRALETAGQRLTLLAGALNEQRERARAALGGPATEGRRELKKALGED